MFITGNLKTALPVHNLWSINYGLTKRHIFGLTFTEIGQQIADQLLQIYLAAYNPLWEMPSLLEPDDFIVPPIRIV